MPLIIGGVALAFGVGATAGVLIASSGGDDKPPEVHVNNKVLNEKIFNFMRTNTATASQDIQTSQIIELQNVNFVGCKKSITQTTDITAKILQNINSEEALDIRDFVENTIANSIDQAMEEENGWLSFGGATSTDGPVTSVKNDIRNVVRTGLTVESIQQMVQNVQLEQNVFESNVTIDPCGFNAAIQAGLLPADAIASQVCQECESTIRKPDGSYETKNCKLPDCPITQDIQLVAIAEQIGNATVNIINDSGVLNQLSQHVDQEKLTKNQGVGGAVSDIFKGMQTPLIISAVVVVIGIILIFLLKPKRIGRSGVEFGG